MIRRSITGAQSRLQSSHCAGGFLNGCWIKPVSDIDSGMLCLRNLSSDTQRVPMCFCRILDLKREIDMSQATFSREIAIEVLRRAMKRDGDFYAIHEHSLAVLGHLRQLR